MLEEFGFHQFLCVVLGSWSNIANCPYIKTALLHGCIPILLLFSWCWLILSFG